MNELGWLSAHISCEQANLDEIIEHGVDPFVQTVLKTREVSRYFFIRHSDGGSHIRLRLREAEPLGRGHIGKLLEQSLAEDFPKRIVAIRPCPGGQSPVASLVYIPYVPEISRYGGSSGLAVAEEHFQFSSAFAMRVIKLTFHASERRYAYGFHLMLASVREIGLSGYAISDFFDIYCDRALRECGIQASSKVRLAVQEWALRRASEIAPFAHVTPKAPKFLCVSDSRIIAEWSNGLRGHIERLRSVQASLSTSLTAILSSYLHMLNNRLGLRLYREAQLAALIAAAVRQEKGYD
jgi:thiopeptide-type bacteriocin biosynthesis protein